MATSTLPGTRPPGSEHASLPALRVLSYFLLLFRRTFRGTIFSGFLSPLLYLVALGYGLGSLVNRSNGIDGVPYVQFIAPGIMVATAMQIAVFDSSYPVLGAIKWQRQYHAMLATPVRVPDIVLGHLGGVTLRALTSGVVFLAVAVALGAVPSWTGVLALVAVLLVALAYAGPMFALAANAQTDISFSIVFRLGIIPMFLFSGTFFPVSQLPHAVQWIAYLVPLYHGSSLARDATLGTLSWGPDLVHVGYLLLWAVAGTVLATRVLQRRMVV
jgi:lipooligosaccharide transport system permease protein